MGSEFEPRIERAIEKIVAETGLPRGQVVLALEGLDEFRRRIPQDVLESSIRETEKDHQESIESTMLKARFGQAGSIAFTVQTVHHRHPTWLERFGDMTVKPATGIPFAVGVLFGVFYAFTTLAGVITDRFMLPVFEGPYDRIMRIFVERVFGSGFIHDMLLGGEGVGYLESLGLLTTGVFVPIGVVLPAVIIFYLLLTLLEDIGYLPRLAVLVDTIFHRLGLHGYSIIPVILALGCNVPGVLAARVLATRRQRFLLITLVGIAVPCMAQTAVVMSIIGPFGFGWVALIYGILLGLFVGIGSLLNRLLPGETPEIAVEIPPYRLPRLSNLAMKAVVRMRHFVADAIPWVFVGIALVNILYMVRFIRLASDLVAPFMERWLGLPEEAIYPLIIGFLRKDVATGILAPMLRNGTLDLYQAIIIVVMLIVYFPCAATFVVFLKEMGVRDTLKSVGVMMGVAVVTGGLLNGILSLVRA